MSSRACRASSDPEGPGSPSHTGAHLMHAHASRACMHHVSAHAIRCWTLLTLIAVCRVIKLVTYHKETANIHFKEGRIEEAMSMYQQGLLSLGVGRSLALYAHGTASSVSAVPTMACSISARLQHWPWIAGVRSVLQTQVYGCACLVTFCIQMVLFLIGL